MEDLDDGGVGGYGEGLDVVVWSSGDGAGGGGAGFGAGAGGQVVRGACRVECYF